MFARVCQNCLEEQAPRALRGSEPALFSNVFDFSSSALSRYRSSPPRWLGYDESH